MPEDHRPHDDTMATDDTEETTMTDENSAPYADEDGGPELAPDDLVTNDAVAGETVLPGAGDGNDGPTGGAPAEGSPVYDEHESDDADADAPRLEQPEAFDVGLDGERHE